MKAREYSPYLETLEPKEKTRGLRTYDPRQVYQYLFDNSDRYGIIIYTQTELAAAIQISRETMNYYFLDFTEVGLLEKMGSNKHVKFRVLFKPEEVEWTDELLDRLSDLRKTHQAHYRRKNKQQGEE